MRPLGGVVVKGKTRPVEIFEVIALSPLVAGDKQRKSGRWETRGQTRMKKCALSLGLALVAALSMVAAPPADRERH